MCMTVVSTLLMSWNSALLMFGTVCSRTLLTWPSTSRESDWECACMQWTIFESFIVSWLWGGNIYRKIKFNLLCLFSKRCLFTTQFVIFRVLEFLQGMECTRNRWGGKLNHLLMARLLNNNCTKNYWDLTLTVKAISGGWVVYFFATQCI